MPGGLIRRFERSNIGLSSSQFIRFGVLSNRIFIDNKRARQKVAGSEILLDSLSA